MLEALIEYRIPPDILIIMLAVNVSYWLCRAFKDVEKPTFKIRKALTTFLHHSHYGLVIMLFSYCPLVSNHSYWVLFIYYGGLTMFLDDVKDFILAVRDTLAKLKELKEAEEVKPVQKKFA